MTRRSLGRGRLLIGLGAIVVLLGALPPWWTVGGTVTQQVTGKAFQGTGIVVFVAAVALLALLVLPYATRTGESRLDRPASYVLLAGVAIASFLLRVLEINGTVALSLPDRAPGLWLSGGGPAVVAWGVAELLAERPAD